MRNRPRDAVTLARVASALDEDRNELGRALAVTYERLGELDGDCGERGSYGGQPGIVVAFERSHRRPVRGDHHEAVVGRRIPVDPDTIERFGGGVRSKPLQDCTSDRWVGGDKGE